MPNLPKASFMPKLSKPRAVETPPPGLRARQCAAEILEGVLYRHRPLDELVDPASHPGLAALAERDRALARALAATALRRLGTLRQLLGGLLDRGFPAQAPRAETALLLGAAQILWFDVPDHAAVDLSVKLARADRRAERHAGLVNAVLRRVAREGAARLAELDPMALDTPDWLLRRWIDAYGAETARAIAAAHAIEPALDLTVKTDPAHWATRLGGGVLPTGTVRLIAHGPIPALPGYPEGAWWVQDAAAALPARLFGDLRGRTAADLCAAPGGKTAQLAAAGAQVLAIDRDERRLARVRRNLDRLGLAADILAADLLEYDPKGCPAAPFDAVLLDPPCSSTGTIRRHPDVPWRKRPSDIAALAKLQQALIARAIEWVKPGGFLVYCTCSLEPEEGIGIITAALAGDPRLRRVPVKPAEIGGMTQCLTADGDLRTLPCHLADPDPRLGGLDGFFAARLERI
jgi:16S rRNA (cytosine967-C5)-methyltransferase